MKDFDILSTCTSGGCGAKIGVSDLGDMLSKLPKSKDENLLIGYDASDDAAVYKVDEETAIVSTVDFFPPMVNDPYVFGQIAATNALSDVYAMGGEVLYALNLVCFPQSLDKEILGQILQGGANKIKEAGAVLSGGHSIYDHETKYGLSVNGKVHPDKYYRNNTPKAGDVLILTKALGVGVVLAAYREQDASKEAYEDAISSMIRLNKYAAEKMKDYTIHACTDVTGFGLMNHLLEMLDNNVSAELYPNKFAYIKEAQDSVKKGYISGGGKRNREHAEQFVDVSTLDEVLQELLFDPQTSGGLLISVSEQDASALLHAIQQDDPNARMIGSIIDKQTEPVIFK